MNLSIVQKCDIVTRELDELKEEMQRVKDDAERSYENFRVRQYCLLIIFVLIQKVTTTCSVS